MSATKRPRFTKEEIDIILKAVKRNPNNKAKAFREASIAMNGTRSISTISNKYYKDLAHKEPKKQIPNKRTKRKPKSLWKRIISSLFNIR